MIKNNAQSIAVPKNNLISLLKIIGLFINAVIINPYCSKKTVYAARKFSDNRLSINKL
jgi:hypothetical protein